MNGEYSDEELEEIHGRTGKWFARFSDSECFKRLTEEEKEESDFVISTFTEYMYSYLEVTPEEWGRVELRECCLEILPRKVSAGESYFRSIAPVLSAFLDFTSRKGLLDNTEGLIEDVKSIAAMIVENGMNPRCWGMAKLMTCTTQEEGVDPTNEAELNEYLLNYNQRLMQLSEEAGSQSTQNYRRETPKVGRNETCPCGSGKKYKKCCGKI